MTASSEPAPELRVAPSPQAEAKSPAGRPVRTPSRRPPAGLSTGPRTARGKRRSSLNRLQRGLCPVWVARELRVRGEDPEAFRCLHRELISWLGANDAPSRMLVEALAEAWWEKRRHRSGRVGATEPDCQEIDEHIDDLLQRLAWCLASRSRKWRHRLQSVLGVRPFGPTHLRMTMESLLPALGGKPPARQAVNSSNLLHDLNLFLSEFLDAVSMTREPEIEHRRRSK